MRPPRDPQVTDLRRYRREREKAMRAGAAKTRPSEPLLGRRRNAAVILVLAIVVLVAMTLLSGHRF